jgi:hypothetical protein
MHLARTPFTAVLVLAAAAGSMSACSGYDAPLPPRPQVVSAASTPPAISGGTLILNEAGDRAFASDPDRDRVVMVELASPKSLPVEIALQDGDEPGRLVEAGNLLFVALRSAGAIALIDVGQATLVDRLNVCAAPRGLAYQAALGLVHVACAGGDLVSLDATDGSEVRRLRFDDDLRDVVVDGATLLISRFRTAEVLRIDEAGLPVGSRMTFQPLVAPGFDEFSGEPRDQVFEPEVAWRMVAKPGQGGALVVHQRAMTTAVKIQTNGYAAGGCDNSVVHGTVGHVPSAEQSFGEGAPLTLGSSINASILPVDLAYSPSSGAVAVVAAGSDKVVIGHADADFLSGADNCGFGMTPHEVPDGPIAVAWSGAKNDFVVQTREPAKLLLLSTGEVIAELGGEDVFDTGHQMFHTNPNGASSLACASCHPEGRDDGRTWNFDPIGPRRTPTLGGGIVTTTAPLHWDGDMTEGLETIMKEVFVNRMGGQDNGPRRIEVFAKWLDALPAFRPIAPADADAAARGEALFHDAVVGCGKCHSGPLFTNNETVDVGTGQAFQVPPLVGLGSRAPYMHDGCAPTLRDRFSDSVPGTDRDSCGGDRHGDVSQLSSEQLDDLVAFLETL